MYRVSNCRNAASLKMYIIIGLRGKNCQKLKKVENLTLFWIFEKVAFGPPVRKLTYLLGQYHKTLKKLELSDLTHGTPSTSGTRLLK